MVCPVERGSSWRSLQVSIQQIRRASLLGCAAAGYSPDRVDALVWALTDLLLEPMSNQGIFELYRQLAQKQRP